VARHHHQQQRRTKAAILTAVATASVCSTLVLGAGLTPSTPPVSSAVTLTSTMIGAGGRTDVFGERVQAKLSGTVQPAGYGYAPVVYPANFDLAGSRDAGVPVMLAEISSRSAEAQLTVVGYSEGALVAERARRELQAIPVDALPPTGPPPPKSQLTFVMIASPFAPNGGLYGRFPGLSIPFIIDPVAPSQPTRYDTTYHALEYDPIADFPAYFNPLSVLNSALGMRYAHPDRHYNPIDPATAPKVTTTVVNSAGGTDTYVLYRNAHLPLLGPIREISANLGLTPLTRPLLAVIEPLLRLVVDMGYTDRTYATAGEHVPFSLITPPGKIIEALLGVPGALIQGVTDAVTGGAPAATAPASDSARTTRALADSPAAATVETSTTAQPLDDDESPTDAIQSAPEDDADGLRPTLVSDGNKATPGGVDPGPTTSVGSADTAETAAPEPETETAAPESDPETPADPPAEAPSTDDATDESADDAAAA
jgi:hypothetical protein